MNVNKIVDIWMEFGCQAGQKRRTGISMAEIKPKVQQNHSVRYKTCSVPAQAKDEEKEDNM